MKETWQTAIISEDKASPLRRQMAASADNDQCESQPSFYWGDAVGKYFQFILIVREGVGKWANNERLP